MSMSQYYHTRNHFVSGRVSAIFVHSVSRSMILSHLILGDFCVVRLQLSSDHSDFAPSPIHSLTRFASPRSRSDLTRARADAERQCAALQIERQRACAALEQRLKDADAAVRARDQARLSPALGRSLSPLLLSHQIS
jgi:hypothetical protein